jgi:hypothetical protein
MPTLISPFTRICREGATTDGRTITRQQIDQMAANYDPQLYGARIWLEHFRSLLPDGIFQALGDVVSCRAEDDSEGKRVLLAELAPTSELVNMNKKSQKVFTSIEMDPSFSDTNEAYLVGLSVTDSPASLGTQMLQFSQKHRADFSQGSSIPDTVFSDSLEVSELAFSEKEENEDKSNLLSRIKQMLSGDKTEANQLSDELKQSILALAESQKELQSQFNKLQSEKSDQGGQALSDKVSSIEQQITALNQTLGKTPPNTYTARPPASGGEHNQLTDC